MGVFSRVIRVDGLMDEATQTRLAKVAQHCPVDRIFETAVRIGTSLTQWVDRLSAFPTIGHLFVTDGGGAIRHTIDD